MSKVRSRLLIIDASVARASGPEDATFPTAKNCRDFLLAVRDICHRMVFSSAIQDEWDSHQSGFARQWRTSMFARKKIERIEVAADETLRSQLENSSVTEKQQEAMLKDAHLIEAARKADFSVVSLDEEVRELFRTVAPVLRRLQKICWVNPDKAEEEVLAWLKAGAPLDETRKLGHASKE